MMSHTFSGLTKAAIAALALAYVIMASGPVTAADIASPLERNADSLRGSKGGQLKMLRRSLVDSSETVHSETASERGNRSGDHSEGDDHYHGDVGDSVAM